MVLGIGGSDGEGLSIAIKARTRDFTSGVRNARNEAVELAGSLQLLQGRADEAADELDDTKRSALFTSGAFSALSLSTEGASLSVGTFSSLLAVSVIPAVLTLSTVLAPLAAIFATIATATVAFGGALLAVPLLGAIGHTEGLKAALQQAREEILAITKPLRDQFYSALLAVIGDLPSLAKRILDAAGGAERFADMFLKLWNVTKRVLPGIIGFMTDLAFQAFPVVMDAIRWLEARAPAAFKAMLRTTERLWPSIQKFGQAFADFLPVLLKFGTRTLELILPALGGLFNVGRRVMRAVLSLRDSFRDLTIAGSILGPVIVGLVSLLGGPVTAAIVAVGAALVGLRHAWKQNLFGIQGHVKRFVATLTSLFDGAMNVIMGVVQEVLRGARRLWRKHGKKVLRTLRNTVSVIVGVITGLADVVIDILRPFFDRMAVFWRKHGKEVTNLVVGAVGIVIATFRGLVNLARGIIEPFLWLMGALWAQFGDEVVAVVTFMADIIISILGGLFETLTTLTDVVTAAMEGDWQKALTSIEDWFRSIFGGILNFIIKWGSGLLDEFVSTITSIITWVSNTAAPWLYRAFLAAGNAIANAMEAALKGARSAVSTVVQGILDAVRAAVNTVEDLTNVKLNIDVPTAKDLLEKVANIGSTAPQGSAASSSTAQQTGRTVVNVNTIEASSRQGGREAARGLEEELDSHNVSGGSVR